MPIASGRVPEVGREETVRAVDWTNRSHLCSQKSEKRKVEKQGNWKDESKFKRKPPILHIFVQQSIFLQLQLPISTFAANSAFPVPVTAELQATSQRVLNRPKTKLTSPSFAHTLHTRTHTFFFLFPQLGQWHLCSPPPSTSQPYILPTWPSTHHPTGPAYSFPSSPSHP